MILAFAFSSSVWVVYYQIANEQVFYDIALLFLLNTIWTLLYDTQYAMADFEDDLKLPINTSVKALGGWIMPFNALLMSVLSAGAVFVSYFWGGITWVALIVTLILFIWQYRMLCQKAWEKNAINVFLSHIYIGGIWCFAIAMHLN